MSNKYFTNYLKSSGLIFFILLFVLFSSFSKGKAVNSGNSYLYINDSPHIKDTLVYVYITSIEKEAKGVILSVDFIQYYSNDEAIKKAKERGDVDTLYKNGKMIISIPGNYYIINESKKIRKFYLAKNVKLNLQLNQDRNHPISNNSLNSLFKIYKDSPFIIHISGNEINAIYEVFLP